MGACSIRNASRGPSNDPCPGRTGAQNPEAGPEAIPGLATLNALTLTVALEKGIEKSWNEAWTAGTRKNPRSPFNRFKMSIVTGRLRVPGRKQRELGFIYANFGYNGDPGLAYEVDG